MRSVFDHPSALAFLKTQIAQNAKTYRYKTQLAEAAGCQPSYLSQVLAGRAPMSLDQASGLCELWRLSALETEFFLTLVQLSRAGTPRLREWLRRKIHRLKDEGTKLAARLPSTELGKAPAAGYYEAWYYTAIHILLTIPGFDTAAKIAERLRLPTEKVTAALQVLQRLELAEQAGGRWRVTRAAVHIPRESPLHGLNHLHWRKRAIDAVEEGRDKLSYTGIHSLSRADLQALWELATDFIHRARQTIEPSPEEELICLSCDLFVI